MSRVNFFLIFLISFFFTVKSFLLWSCSKGSTQQLWRSWDVRQQPYSNSHFTKLQASWLNYDSDGQKEGTILFGLLVAFLVRANFSTAELRNTYICPFGPNAEKSLKEFMASEPGYKCSSLREWVSNVLTGPFVLPGDENYDPEFIKMKMIKIQRVGSKTD